MRTWLSVCLCLCVGAAQEEEGRLLGAQRQTPLDPALLARFGWSELALEGRGPPAFPLASEAADGLPVYVSMTTIRSRLYGIAPTVQSIFAGSLKPTRLFVLLSNESFLLDEGVPPHLLLRHEIVRLARLYPISVVYTGNMGPHRKLLPLLARKWNEDCLIVTADDHEIYPRSMLESLVKFFLASGRRAVVALRSRRIGVCSTLPWRSAPYTRNRRGLWPESGPGKREMLALPTGTGGVLYRPRFFDPVVFSAALVNATVTGDDLLFRLATMARGVKVVTACVLEEGGAACRDLASSAVERRLRPFLSDSEDQRRRRTTSKKDPRKEVSLASRFNAGGGNNQMWADATALLSSMRLLDLNATLERYAPLERGGCLRYMGRADASFLGGLLERMLVGYQGAYDKECGIWAC